MKQQVSPDDRPSSTGTLASRARHSADFVPVTIGLGFGAAQGAAPLAFWWLPPATVYAISIAFIATVYIGFAVADGRRKVVIVETIVAVLFIVIAALGVTGSPWLLVAGLFAHGCKDLWQHHTGFVRSTRWWPPFCVAVDWVAAGILAIAIVTGFEALAPAA